MLNNKYLKSRKKKDNTLNIITFIFSSFSAIVLSAIIIFIFKNGFNNLNMKLLTSDYYETPYFASVTKSSDITFDLNNESNIYYSSNFGIGLSDDLDLNGNEVVIVSYIDNLSPLKNMDNNITLEVNQIIKRISIINSQTGETIIGISKYKAEELVKYFDMGSTIVELYFTTIGGGIRGSIITTLYLIILTLIIVIPLGIISAVYLQVFAKDNKLTNIIRTLIDVIGGIPSIIFGLISVIIFIPFVNSITGKSGGSILSGALTLSLMLLPTVIKTTEEAIKRIPKSYIDASYALGVSKTKTIFKIILPNSISGIITSSILVLGRIIGESAALIFAIGTSIKDSISITDSSTSLAVHIWTILSSENPNFEVASSISIVILSIVLILNISMKLISNKFNKGVSV